ncbi:hypothetical protein N825_21880 [Skermanella stibiiresistens SB22]|uniref:Uncharacterized protein n=1 Tax=Skermanella stibiiresistens SB22 TaxID=1385369 RepID=W9GTJ2_9PROT|nr:hypothetical protein [Skermanella stibiiresistens]EWY37099.1 hypothetical protein N825_21880 [Skermanella stibiiresistens SB22]
MFVLLAGLICLAKGPDVALKIFFPSTLLQAAAAINLPALGSSVITPSYVLIGFFVLSLATRAEMYPRMMRPLSFPEPGFYLLCTTIFCLWSAMFLPRLFAGEIIVFSIARGDAGEGIALRLLAPSASNITQAVYFLSNLVCFVLVARYIAVYRKWSNIAEAVLICGALNLFFAALDLISFRMGWPLLEIVRTANYRMLVDGEILGLKRIVGSFPEAGAFGYATMGIFAFSLKVWLGGHYQRAAGWITCLSFLALLLCTSSTAYVTMVLFSLFVYMESLMVSSSGDGRNSYRNVLLYVPVILMTIVLIIVMNSTLIDGLQQFFERTLFNKLETQSGKERSEWNMHAARIFIETMGLGAGVGSVRASSIILAMLSNIGVLGTLLYGGFLLTLLRRDTGKGPSKKNIPLEAVVRDGARSSCLAMLIASAMSAGSIDLGLTFFFFAGVVCAPMTRPIPKSVPV